MFLPLCIMYSGVFNFFQVSYFECTFLRVGFNTNWSYEILNRYNMFIMFDGEFFITEKLLLFS